MSKRTTPIDRITDPADWPEGQTTDLAAMRAQEMARRINTAQQEQGLTMRDLAGAANLSVSTIHRIINGHVWPDIATITALEQALDVTLLPEYRASGES